MNVKISEEQYLGSHELNKLKNSIIDQGYQKFIKQQVISPGLINGFNITQSNVNEVSVSNGLGIDVDGLFLGVNEEKLLTIPNNSLLYWIKAQHRLSSLEEGTVSVDSLGNLTGLGTKFNESLRGLPNTYLSVIKFESSTNTQEYLVNTVNSDISAVLQGDFIAESDLKYSVVGSFSAQTNPSAQEKFIFQYDDIELTLIQSSMIPNLIPGKEFLLASVLNDGSGTLAISDFRAKYRLSNRPLFDQPNPLIGVEYVKHKSLSSTRVSNIVRLGFGLRSSNYTVNRSEKTLTFNSANGGRYITTANFQNGDCIGWRVYDSSNQYAVVTNSILQGGQINFTLDFISGELFLSNREISVVPPVDLIQIKCKAPNQTSSKVFEVKPSLAYIDLELEAYNPTSTFEISYNYQIGESKSKDYTLQNNNTGYLNETSFSVVGDLLPEQEQNRTAFTNSTVTIVRASDAYRSIVDQFVAQDAAGIQIREFDNQNPVINLTPRTSPAVQLFDHVRDGFDLANDLYINIITTSGGNQVAQDGNSFTIDIRGEFLFRTNRLRIVTGYVNTGDIGTVIDEIVQEDLPNSSSQFRALYQYDIETDEWIKFLFSVTPTRESLDVYSTTQVDNNIQAAIENPLGFGIGDYDITTVDLNQILSGVVPNDQGGSTETRLFALRIDNLNQRVFKITDSFGGTRGTDNYLILSNIQVASGLTVPQGHKIWVLCDENDMSPGTHKVTLGVGEVIDQSQDTTMQAFTDSNGPFNIQSNIDASISTPFSGRVQTNNVGNTGNSHTLDYFEQSFLDRNEAFLRLALIEFEYIDIVRIPNLISSGSNMLNENEVPVYQVWRATNVLRYTNTN